MSMLNYICFLIRSLLTLLLYSTLNPFFISTYGQYAKLAWQNGRNGFQLNLDIWFREYHVGFLLVIENESTRIKIFTIHCSCQTRSALFDGFNDFRQKKTSSMVRVTFKVESVEVATCCNPAFVITFKFWGYWRKIIHNVVIHYSCYISNKSKFTGWVTSMSPGQSRILL